MYIVLVQVNTKTTYYPGIRIKKYIKYFVLQNMIVIIQFL